MSRYKALTDGLPEFVCLRGLAEFADEHGIALDSMWRSVEQFPDEDEGPEFERAIVAVLIDALEEAGIDVRVADAAGHTMTHEDHWVDYCRQSAEEAGDLAHVALHVDWQSYAKSMRTDTIDIVVRHGRFAGTWYLRR